MEEQIYLQEGGVLVTSSRLVLDGQTFALRNVGSVKVEGGGRPWLGMLLGLFAVSAGSAGNAPLALLLAGAAGYMGWRKVQARHLVILAGGGETVGLRSTDGKRVERIRAAVEAAISQR